MHRDHLWEYAEHVVGFPIRPGTEILVDEDCTGTDENRVTHETPAGSRGRVGAIKMFSYPEQLTISVKIMVDSANNVFIRRLFCENDPGKQFPFRKWPVTPPKEPEPKDQAAATEDAEAKSESAGPVDHPPDPGLNQAIKVEPGRGGGFTWPHDNNPDDNAQFMGMWGGHDY